MLTFGRALTINRVMEKTITITITDIGSVLMRKSEKARRLSLSVLGNGEIRVAVPLRESFRRAEAFVREKANWVAWQREKIKLLRRRHEELRAAGRYPSRDEAKALLRDRLLRLALEHGFNVGVVSVRNQRTRWGSCSARNNISLNEKLARLPYRLIDYVLLHELVHTRTKGHGADFWRDLDAYVGDSKGLRRELRQYRLEFLS